MRVLVLTRYGNLGSSSRVRFYQYLPYLREHGIEITAAPLLDDDYIACLYSGKKTGFTSILHAYAERFLWLMRVRKFDLIWLEKEILPWFPPVAEWLLNLFQIPYVVDYDDAVFHRYNQHPNRFIRFFLGRKIDHIMHMASLVVTGNEYLKEWAVRSGSRKVEILPSVVNVPRYEPGRGAGKSTFRIGWIGSPVTAPFLSVIDEALRQASKFPGVEIVLIGAGVANPLPGIDVTLLPWNEGTEISLLAEFDVGLMPLPDGPFERGKCGYKLIQYMAAGIPVIASPVGVNNQIVIPGENGLLAGSTEEWVSAFHTFYDQPDKRIQMGAAGRKLAEKFYSLDVTAPRLLEILLQFQHG